MPHNRTRWKFSGGDHFINDGGRASTGSSDPAAFPMNLMAKSKALCGQDRDEGKWQGVSCTGLPFWKPAGQPVPKPDRRSVQMFRMSKSQFRIRIKSLRSMELSSRISSSEKPSYKIWFHSWKTSLIHGSSSSTLAVRYSFWIRRSFLDPAPGGYSRWIPEARCLAMTLYPL